MVDFASPDCREQTHYWQIESQVKIWILMFFKLFLCPLSLEVNYFGQKAGGVEWVCAMPPEAMPPAEKIEICMLQAAVVPRCGVTACCLHETHKQKQPLFGAQILECHDVGKGVAADASREIIYHMRERRLAQHHIICPI